MACPLLLLIIQNILGENFSTHFFQVGFSSQGIMYFSLLPSNRRLCFSSVYCFTYFNIEIFRSRCNQNSRSASKILTDKSAEKIPRKVQLQLRVYIVFNKNWNKVEFFLAFYRSSRWYFDTTIIFKKSVSIRGIGLIRFSIGVIGEHLYMGVELRVSYSMRLEDEGFEL